LSTTEAEYIALSQAMQELLHMQEFMAELQQNIDVGYTGTTKLHSTVFEDNNGALTVAQAPKMTPRTKHIAIKYHFFKDRIGQDKGIELAKIDTLEQIADIFTKGLGQEKFQHLRQLLCGW
jgi:galactokinase/mevalonate kinase-like predicted kinase